MRTTLLPLALCVTLPCAAVAQDSAAWPQFRGPGGLAVAAETPIPLDFGPESGVLWKTTIPAGHSSPCVYGDRIFLTGADEAHLYAVAINRQDGAVLWKRAFEGEQEPDYEHVAAAPALPTACTDGERVYVYFGAYGLIALDFDGKTVWEKRLPVPSSVFGTGTSPALAGENVILMRDGAPEAAVLAFDAETGEEAWSIPRTGFISSHSTPFVWHTKEGDELVIAGTKQVRSYDLSTGASRWTVDNVTLLTCTTPAANEDTLFFAGWSTPNASGRNLMDQSFGPQIELSDEEVDDLGLLFDRLDKDGDGHLLPADVPKCRARDAFAYIDADGNGTWERAELIEGAPTGAPGKNVMVAIAAGGKGDVTESHVRWTWKRGLPYVASPLLYKDRVWLFKAGGLVTCLDAKTGGSILNRERLPARGEYYASPVGVAGHILACESDGRLFILNATADELEIVHSADFDESLYATPAVVEGKVYLRTSTTLWAFGE